MKLIEENEILAANEVETKCGFVAIVGRPNVGKSTLMNAMLGKKVSITSYKPQTTRFQILGIKTQDNTQVVFVDTPGIHLGAKHALNRQMNKVAHQALIDVNAVVFVVEALKWTDEDEYVCKVLQNIECPIIIALNKIDLVPRKEELLLFIQKLSALLPHAEIVPISARKRQQIDRIAELSLSHIPPSPFYFPEDQVVNHNESFHAAEIVREKLMRLLAQEIPYATTVQIEQFKREKNIIHIHALIWAEREGQKRVIIGDKGSKLKEIGTLAREDLEKFLEKKVCLILWVKVHEGWSDNMHALSNLGYLDA
jgi:GTP-binding protein Era